MSDEDTAKDESTQDSAEVADSETETDTQAEDVSGDDTPASEESDKAPMIPKERFDEVNTRMKRAEEKVDDLSVQYETLARLQQASTKTEEKGIVDKLEAQGYDSEQIELLKGIAKEFGGGQDAHDKIQKLEAKLAEKDDKAELSAAVKKYEGGGVEITEAEVSDQVNKWYKDGDPKYQLPYEDVIFFMKKKEITEKEVNESIDSKTSTPKIDKGKAAEEKEPESKRFVYDPSDPAGSMAALENEVLTRLTAEEG